MGNSYFGGSFCLLKKRNYMKKFFTISLLTVLSFSLNAQIIDTVLFENFQNDPFPNLPSVPTGNDTTWVNCDEDGLAAITGEFTDQFWAFAEFYFNALDSITGETNYCASSYSYLEGSKPGNRNWLITPPIQVQDANYTLHWKSASYQMPRYLDGYLVLAAENTNNLFEGDFKDTLFQAASMVAITGDGESINVSNFEFTDGYIHANNVTDHTYYLDGTGIAYGLLEPHSVSLSQYSGKTIYLAFLHNSDDDNLLALDDILVTRTATSGTFEANLADLRFVTFPNPVENFINVMFRLQQPTDVALKITDVLGHEIQNINLGRLAAGEQQQDLNLRNLPAGQYFVSIQAGETMAARSFIKK